MASAPNQSDSFFQRSISTSTPPFSEKTRTLIGIPAGQCCLELTTKWRKWSVSVSMDHICYSLSHSQDMLQALVAPWSTSSMCLNVLLLYVFRQRHPLLAGVWHQQTVTNCPTIVLSSIPHHKGNHWLAGNHTNTIQPTKIWFCMIYSNGTVRDRTCNSSRHK